MKMDDPKYARTLERREARARRSKTLGRFVVMGFGVCVMLTLRMNPALATDFATYFAETPARQTSLLPGAQPVAQMPLNKVKVRKGTGFGTQTNGHDSQAVAQDLGHHLGSIKVGQ